MTETDPDSAPAVVRGFACVQAHLAAIPHQPGCYKMLGAEDELLYIGKARDLRKRVANYARPRGHTMRIRRMIQQIQRIELTPTDSEVKAFILESQLIKTLKPKYNVLLKDSKSYPHIVVRTDHAYPQILKHRGSKTHEGEYYGPFANTAAVNNALTAVQQGFLLRTCSDSVFAQRKRPCLQYQIRRCSAPCVQKISEAEYGQTVEQANNFLHGRADGMRERLVEELEKASETWDYERAAMLRNRIESFSRVQIGIAHGHEVLGNADVVIIARAGGDLHTKPLEGDSDSPVPAEATKSADPVALTQFCIVEVFFLRSGYNFGQRLFTPRHSPETPTEEVLEAFLGQFYADKQPPQEILLNHPIPHDKWLQDALSAREETKIRVVTPQRGPKRRAVDTMAEQTHRALARMLAEKSRNVGMLALLAARFQVPQTPITRVDVFDNSHLMGKNAVGAMIVAGPEGFVKAEYRKFNMRKLARDATEITGGDDFAMLREMLTRRLKRLENADGTSAADADKQPQVLLLDGGKGQLTQAEEVCRTLGIDNIKLIAIAKGKQRNAGRETFFIGFDPDPAMRHEGFTLPPNDPLLYYLQRLRDEAHRFAIGSHRSARGKTMRESAIDNVQGVGARRKRALIAHFGSVAVMRESSIEDITSVPGIDRKTAERIWGFLNN